MASLTIRNLDEGLKHLLRLRAAVNSRSMEEEVRQILRSAVEEVPTKPQESLAARINPRFHELDADTIQVPERRAARVPPDMSDQ